MCLPTEIKNYRSKMYAIYWNKATPRLIAYKWDSDIEPSNLYSLGEEGAERYLKGKNLGEKSLIFFALYAESLGRTEMANGFWKRAYRKSCELPSSKDKKNKPNKKGKNEEQNTTKATISFQELLFSIIREQRKYVCHSIFLTLPSDKEAIRYLREYYEELQIISGPNTLIMSVGSDQKLHATVGDKTFSVELKEAYSKITNSFHIDFTMIPCMIIFEGINSSEGTPIFLKGMNAEEISEKLRVIFSIIDKAARTGQSPIDTLQKHKKDEQLRHAKKEIIGAVSRILDYPLKIYIQEHIKQQLRPTST